MSMTFASRYVYIPTAEVQKEAAKAKVSALQLEVEALTTAKNALSIKPVSSDAKIAEPLKKVHESGVVSDQLYPQFGFLYGEKRFSRDALDSKQQKRFPSEDVYQAYLNAVEKFNAFYNQFRSHFGKEFLLRDALDNNQQARFVSEADYQVYIETYEVFIRLRYPLALARANEQYPSPIKENMTPDDWEKYYSKRIKFYSCIESELMLRRDYLQKAIRYYSGKPQILPALSNTGEEAVLLSEAGQLGGMPAIMERYQMQRALVAREIAEQDAADVPAIVAARLKAYPPQPQTTAAQTLSSQSFDGSASVTTICRSAPRVTDSKGSAAKSGSMYGSNTSVLYGSQTTARDGHQPNHGSLKKPNANKAPADPICPGAPRIKPHDKGR